MKKLMGTGLEFVLAGLTWAVLMWLAAHFVCACVVQDGAINDPRTYALEDDGGMCGTRAQVKAEVLGRLGIDEASCKVRSADVDACADDASTLGQGTIVVTYFPYETGTAARVHREPGGGWWSVVCSCVGCSDELSYDGAWPARIPANGTGQTFLF